MKKYFVRLLILFGFAVLHHSCHDENPVVTISSIYGSWVREITDSEGIVFTARLSLKSNNTYDFEVLSVAPGHSDGTGGFKISSGFLTIIDDAQCGFNGSYEFVIGLKSLALVAFDDDCPPRVTALQGVWTKEN
ncbi:MAG: hypothetical protein ACOYN5_01860 [Bacteroidales bacterium]